MKEKNQKVNTPQPEVKFENIYPKELSIPRNNEIRRINERKQKKKADSK